MLAALQKPYATISKSKVLIRVDRSIVENISICFAKAQMLDLELARKMQGFYAEDPHQLLTIVTPTNFPAKLPFFNNSNSTCAIYDKTTLETILKILAEQLIRPAAWIVDPQGIPKQFPSYGFFRVSAELNSMNLNPWLMNVVTTGLYRIGKNALPADLIAILRAPQMSRHGAGGNDQLQRGCKLAGAARGSAAMAIHSDFATVAFVAATQTVPDGSITWQYKSEKDMAKTAEAERSQKWFAFDLTELYGGSSLPGDLALHSLCYIQFYVIFWRTTWPWRTMFLYLVLTLKGIVHGDIKGVFLEWLGLSQVPYNLFNLFYSLSPMVAEAAVSLFFRVLLLGLSQVPLHIYLILRYMHLTVFLWTFGWYCWCTKSPYSTFQLNRRSWRFGRMASQDYISQYAQGIPATQPERSLSKS